MRNERHRMCANINLCDKGLRLVVDETKKTMKLSRDVPYSEIFDLSILKEAQRELGNQTK